MTATGHALVAALIAAKFHNPYIALPLALASHFACDLIPHWDSGTHHGDKSKERLFYESAADVTISVISAFVLYHFVLGQHDYVYLYINVFLSQLPDWITAPYLILKTDNPFVFFSKHMYKVQHMLNVRLDRPWGVLTQILTVIILYILLFRIF